MHINEDKLLEYALKIVEDDEERMEIERHLKACQSCRSELKRALRDIDIISNIQLNHPVAATSTAQRKRSMLYPLFRAAALIIFGVAMGFGASSAWLVDKPTRVVPQYITLSSPADSISQYPVPDAIEILPEYWVDTFGYYQVDPPTSTP